MDRSRMPGHRTVERDEDAVAANGYAATDAELNTHQNGLAHVSNRAI
jgi:hypothetical protein